MCLEFALRPEENHVVDQLISDKGLFISDVIVGIIFNYQIVLSLDLKK